jgi:hypothetical protein
MQTDYPLEYGFGALAIPAITWLAVAEFYLKYRKESREKPTL